MFMFVSKLFVFILFTSLAFGADVGTFKNCSRVDFCTTLRARVPTNDYTIDAATVSGSSDSNVFTATLISSSELVDLTLTISGFENGTFRLQISEVGSSRYELEDVLDGEPSPLNFDSVDVGGTSATLTTDSGLNTLLVNFSPFSIEFSKNGSTEIIFNGERLTMTTTTTNAPFSFGLTFPLAYQLYGIPEHCDSFPLKNTAQSDTDPYRLKNSDVSYYETESPMALYGSVPVIYGHGPGGTAAAFLHNAAEQWIETTSNEGNSEVYLMVETGALDLFIFLGPTPADVVRQYTALTGIGHLPQIWALGYHQSRYSYDTQDLVGEVISGFDDNNFQLESIWLDIDYTDGYRYFTWNLNNFNDPVGLQETLASTNKKLVTIINPHVKVEEGYSVYDGASSNDLFVKNSDGSVYEGPCWPGTSSYIDFLNPTARDYYASLHSYENFEGSTSTLAGIWNDMNEPSVFDNSLELTLPTDALHYGNVTHKEIHNIYGLLHTKATHQGLLARDNNTVRPFILTRSHFAGSQRYAGLWTGDNTADWPYLRAAFQQCLNANMLGLVLCGADVGGFFNNPSTELLERWYQAGAWLPFYRGHSTKDANRREPYLLDEDSQEVVRNAIQTRYRHLPVWYTLFFEYTRTGDPVIRPLFYHYPEDPNVYSIDNQLLVGQDILVTAVTEPGATEVNVYFPGGEDEIWVSMSNKSDVQQGNGFVSVPVERENIPVYYRRGACILRKETIRSNTAEMDRDSYTLYYNPDANGAASGRIYIDDGVSFKYRDESDYTYYSIGVTGNSFSIRTIDGKNSYSFTMNVAVQVNIIEMPTKGKPGRYEEKIFTRANGQMLKDIVINPKTKTVLFLEE